MISDGTVNSVAQAHLHRIVYATHGQQRIMRWSILNHVYDTAIPFPDANYFGTVFVPDEEIPVITARRYVLVVWSQEIDC